MRRSCVGRGRAGRESEYRGSSSDSSTSMAKTETHGGEAGASQAQALTLGPGSVHGTPSSPTPSAVVSRLAREVLDHHVHTRKRVADFTATTTISTATTEHRLPVHTATSITTDHARFKYMPDTPCWHLQNVHCRPTQTFKPSNPNSELVSNARRARRQEEEPRKKITRISQSKEKKRKGVAPTPNL